MDEFGIFEVCLGVFFACLYYVAYLDSIKWEEM
jgi:hypothetical protein